MHSLSKSFLRQSGLNRRSALSPREHASFSAACCRSLCALIEEFPGSPAIVAGYSAARDELDLSHALHHLAERHTLVLPVVKKGEKILAFRRYHRGDTLTAGAFGILNPSADAELLTPSVVIIPLLAFDRSGHRLGYGAGYYDRTLAALRAAGPVVAIGAAFALQEVEVLPAEPMDERLDYVVTEKEVIKIT